jgi:hypothetical protein
LQDVATACLATPPVDCFVFVVWRFHFLIVAGSEVVMAQNLFPGLG